MIGNLFPQRKNAPGCLENVVVSHFKFKIKDFLGFFIKN